VALKHVAATVAVLAVLAGGCAPGQHAVEPSPLTLPAPPSSAVVDKSVPVVSVPVAMRIPKIGAQSSLVQLGLNPDGSVQVPPVSEPLQAGWYAGGAAPGEIGPAVLLGHVDGNHQAGIFFRLHELVPGDDVFVTRKDGVVLHFTVTAKSEVPKNAFPTEAVYGKTVGPELRLITCGGSFDAAAHSYVDNIVVYATLAR
jgi:hypothetical protein